MKPVKVGVVGCGNISRIYLENLTRRYESVEVIAVSSRTRAKAEAAAARYGIPKVESVDGMLCDPEVELVVNLTTPESHFAITREALQNGKCVYSEKPLAETGEEAAVLLSEAEKSGTVLCCAPDIFLGEAQQAARRALDEGKIGRVLSAGACFLNHGAEGWHPSPEYFYLPGGGPVFDMGPYYLTALTALLGPVRTVAALCSRSSDERVLTSPARYGEKIPVKVPTHVNGLLSFACGVNASVTFSYDSWGSAFPHLELRGELGTMILPDPNLFGGEVLCKTREEEQFYSLTGPTDSYNARGLGIEEMARALREGRRPRTEAHMAAHVVEIMEGLIKSGETGEFVTLTGSFERTATF